MKYSKQKLSENQQSESFYSISSAASQTPQSFNTTTDSLFTELITSGACVLTINCTFGKISIKSFKIPGGM